MVTFATEHVTFVVTFAQIIYYFSVFECKKVAVHKSSCEGKYVIKRKLGHISAVLHFPIFPKHRFDLTCDNAL